MTNIHTLQLLAWLTFFFFLALMLDEECNPLSETDRCSWRELSLSSSIACGPSTVLFLIATTPVSIEIMWCAWKYQCIHDDIFYLDNIAFLIAPAAAISLFLLAFPFNIYKYEYYHSCFAAVFFGSVYVHMGYVSYRSMYSGTMQDRERSVCALWMVANLLIVVLGFSHTGWQCKRCTAWFGGAEIAYMAVIANYTYLLKAIVDAKDSTSLLSPSTSVAKYVKAEQREVRI